MTQSFSLNLVGSVAPVDCDKVDFLQKNLSGRQISKSCTHPAERTSFYFFILT